MHALVLLCINQHTKFEVPSFTNFKYMIENKMLTKGSCDLDYANYGVVYHLKAST